jgi:hypothetical protein
MKLICDCGNEEEFNTIDKETENPKGQCVSIKGFGIVTIDHYETRIQCSKCGKAIWMFT